MSMSEAKVIELYKKERDYQRCCFGEYVDVKSLTFSSFLHFIEAYLNKAKSAYCGPWKKDLPSWMNNCKEMEEGSAPIEAYEELIKVMALAGAALETYSDLNPQEWRPDPEQEGQKWK